MTASLLVSSYCYLAPRFLVIVMVMTPTMTGMVVVVMQMEEEDGHLRLGKGPTGCRHFRFAVVLDPQPAWFWGVAADHAVPRLGLGLGLRIRVPGWAQGCWSLCSVL